MSLQAGSLLAYLLVTCVYVCRGLHITFDRTPYNQFCAQLLCDEEISQSDEQISYLIELSIYNITLAQPAVKLASVSILEPGVYVDPSKFNVINGTGSISSSEGRLALSFQDVADCLRGTFLCQLDFVTVSGHPGTTTESTISGDSDHCSLFEKLLTARIDNLTIENTALEGNVTQLSDEKLVLQSKVNQLSGEKLYLQSNVTQLSDEKLVLQSNVTQLSDEKLYLQSNVTQLSGEKLYLQSKVNQLSEEKQVLQSSLENATQRIAMLEALVPGTNCFKGMPSTTSRQVFLLWGRVPALCDTETDGGGWVIIQRRTKGDVDFYRGWADYKNGFGTPDNDFWVGLGVIHNLTTQGYSELRFDLQDNSKNYFAHYSHFTVADEFSKYQLSVGVYNGTAGDSFTYHNGSLFATYDNDVLNCATVYHGAWWYRSCYSSNLNGQWGVDNNKGVTWLILTGNRSLTSTEMKVRLE